MRVVIAGASGFVGRALLHALAPTHEVLALARSADTSTGGPLPGAPGVRWRKCDLFSLEETQAALAGAEVGIYLVHSMLPSARLTQGNFADMDFLLADNFARGAARAGLRRLLYLGGLIPGAAHLSAHLQSRLEVEETLRAGATPVVGLRAGLIIGPQSSSFRILERLVRRLPVMALPRWTRTPTQPVALQDVVEVLRRCLDAPGVDGQSFDLGGPDVVDYAQLISRTAAALGLQRKLFPVRFFSPGLSTLWVSLISGAPRELVAPLVQSLRHPMVAADRRLQAALGIPGLSLDAALHLALQPLASAPDSLRPSARTLTLAARAAGARDDVRSVQRLPLPEGWTAEAVAWEYLRWLPRFLRPLLRVETEPSGRCRFFLWPFRRCLLELTLDGRSSTEGRHLFTLTGGRLVDTASRPPGRLEFVEMLGKPWVVAAVHDFTPTLPWYLYKLSQAPVHLWVMHAFGRHLRRAQRAGATPPPLAPAPPPKAPALSAVEKLT
jgi:uncharacterized protein YbjT (DUF2867 family)